MKKIYSIFTFAFFSLTIIQNAKGQAQIVANPPCPGAVSVINLRDIPPFGSGSTRCVVFVTAPSIYTGYEVTIYSGPSTDLIPVAITAGGVLTTSTTAPFIAGTVIDYACSAGEITYISLQNGPAGSACFTPVAFSASLPIKLTAFNATIQGNNSVVLSWTSEFEANSSNFSIEKSGDGKNFTTIGSVKAAGTSTNPIKYSYTDANFSGTAFYRLKMVDLDGKSEYSKTVYANGGSGSANGVLSVFPNPFRSDVQLKGINASDVNKDKIRIYTVTGQTVNYSITGSNSISIDPALPKGVYILRVKDQTYKLFKN